MLSSTQTVKQELLQKIEYLPDHKLQEVLNFVEFLLFKGEFSNKEAPTTQYSQQEILEGLTRIRETVHQSYGMYEGDLIAEVREERDQQLDATLGLDVIDENSH